MLRVYRGKVWGRNFGWLIILTTIHNVSFNFFKLTFEGLWSRNTHPKDFPTNSWLTRFSDIIGATHAIDYRFWQYGEQASEGLRQVAERGATRMLESELKNESEHIRTIIKARGLAYPNVTGRTFAVFRVDPINHLVSFVSMIDPSPDWFVGVSGLELCLPNCTWIENKVLELYPWDAGTDSGATYIVSIIWNELWFGVKSKAINQLNCWFLFSQPVTRSADQSEGSHSPHQGWLSEWSTFAVLRSRGPENEATCPINIESPAIVWEKLCSSIW